MARRNRRVEADMPPLDLTPAQANRTPAPNPFTMAGESFEKVRAARREREREAIARQRKARIQGGIDWSVCLVPGCGSTLSIYMMLTSEPEDRDPDKILPLCNEHTLAKGREWYEDGPIVRLFIDDALARHGAPTIKVRWTEPKSPLVRVKGYRG